MPFASGASSNTVKIIPFLAVTSIGYVLFAPAAVPDTLTSQFGIDYTTFGLLTSAPLFSVVLAQAPSSYLTARHSTTRILLVATTLHVVLAVALDFTTTILTLLGLRTVWGLTCGIILTVGATHVARLHQGANATLQQGIYGGVLTLGGAFAFLIVPSLLTEIRLIGLHSPGVLFGMIAVVSCWWHRHESITKPSHPQPTSKAADTDTPSNMDTQGVEDRHLRGKHIEATRHRLYSGAGIATASMIGCIGAAVLELTLAIVFFGLAIPILVYQIRREYYRLQYLERRTPHEQGDTEAPV